MLGIIFNIQFVLLFTYLHVTPVPHFLLTSIYICLILCYIHDWAFKSFPFGNLRPASALYIKPFCVMHLAFNTCSFLAVGPKTTLSTEAVRGST